MVASFFDGPVFSIVLCLLAGIALRYAIYYGRDGAAEDAAKLAEMRRVQDEYRERQFAMQQALDQALQQETVLRNHLDRLLADVETSRTRVSTEPMGTDGNESELQQRISDLEQDLSLQESMLRELRLQKEEVLTHLERERNERYELQQTLSIPGDRWQHNAGHVDAVESLLQQVGMRQLSIHDGSEHAYPDEVLDRVGAHDAPPILAFNTVAGHAAEEDDSVIDPARGRIYAHPPRVQDDLRKISGIGEILSQKLHGLGIYTYQQIMQWETKQVREFSRLLAFRDRIEREQWVAQARRLYQETRGEAA